MLVNLQHIRKYSTDRNCSDPWNKLHDYLLVKKSVNSTIVIIEHIVSIMAFKFTF